MSKYTVTIGQMYAEAGALVSSAGIYLAERSQGSAASPAEANGVGPTTITGGQSIFSIPVSGQ